jgi:hypothetical protein
MSATTVRQDPFIFLSYAREDEPRAEQILQALREQGYRVFLDRHMPSGVYWEDALKTSLEGAFAVIVIWSSRSVNSQWVMREAAVGLEKKMLFPILIENDVAIPAMFKHVNAADLRGWEGNPKDEKFKGALTLLQLLWEAQNGLLKKAMLMKPLQLKRRPEPEEAAET